MLSASIFNSPVDKKHRFCEIHNGAVNVYVISQSDCSFFFSARYTNYIATSDFWISYTTTFKIAIADFVFGSKNLSQNGTNQANRPKIYWRQSST